jgi:predicted TIM-barrel fold metal-dependent hydrolase
MGEMANDLRALGKLFDQYPNFYVDISDRINELGRQPYTARDFFIKYQDRILFGIDLYPETHVYQAYYRFLETKDEYFDYPRHYFKHGRWKIYGLGLPDAVLEKVYYQNAARLLRLNDF